MASSSGRSGSGTSTNPAASPPQGSRYTVLAELARGGLGRVFTGTDDALGRPVAIKQVLDPTPATLARFEREAKLTARLQHSGVVPVYDIGRWDDGEPFFVMKMVEGRSLADLIHETPSCEERLALLPRVLAVANTMAYVHSRGVIHRDLKPSNVVISEYGETVVIDWGLARMTVDTDEAAEDHVFADEHRTAGLTEAGRVLGTPQFMAPEQAEGAVVDERSDVYALGAILYNVLLGEEPYAGTSRSDLLAAVKAGPPPPLRGRVPHAPDDLAAIVAKAMARDPEQRYPTAREVAEDLRRFLDGQLVSAHRYSAPALFARWLRRHRAAVSVATVLLAALAAAALVGVRRVVAERNAAVTARGAALERENSLVLVQAEHSLAHDPTAAIAWLKRHRQNRENAWLSRAVAEEAAARGTARHVLGFEVPSRGFAASAAQPILAVGGNDGAVWLYNLETGARTLLGRHQAAVTHLAFLPHGRALVALDGDGKLRLWELGGRLLHHLALEKSVAPGNLAVSADGRTVAVGLGDQLIVIPVDNPARRASVALGGRVASLGFCGTAALVAIDFAGRALVLDPDQRHPRLLNGRHPDARLACLPGGQRFVTAGVDGEVQLWEIATGALRRLGKHQDWVSSIAASPDGSLVATTSGDDTVHIHDLSGGPTKVLRGHEDTVQAAVFSKDGTSLASVSHDSIRVWDPRSGDLLHQYRGLRMQAMRIALSHDGLHFITSGLHDARVWPARVPRSHALGAHADLVKWIRWTPDGRSLVSGSRDRTVRAWDLATGARWSSAPLDSWPTTAGFIEGNRLFVSTRGRQALLFDVATGKANQTAIAAPGTRATIASLRVSPSGDRVALAEDRSVVIEELATGRRVQLETGQGRVRALQFSRDGTRIAVTTAEGTAGLWEVRTGRKLALRQFPVRIEELVIAPDGRHVGLLTSYSYRLFIWDLTRDQVRELPSDGAPAAMLFFTLDSRSVAYRASDRAIRFVDIDSGQARLLRGHRSRILTVTLSRAAHMLASGDADGFVRLWDLSSWKSGLLQAHAGGVDEVAFSPDGKSLATAGLDASIRVWELGSIALGAPASDHEWLQARSSAVMDASQALRTPR